MKYSTLKTVIFCKLLRLPASPILKNQKFPLGMLILRKKIFLILYTPFENPTTRTAIAFKPKIHFLTFICIPNYQKMFKFEINRVSYLTFQFSWKVPRFGKLSDYLSMCGIKSIIGSFLAAENNHYK